VSGAQCMMNNCRNSAPASEPFCSLHRFPKPKRKDGGEPCGECHLQPGERCDICGARRLAALNTRPLALIGQFAIGDRVTKIKGSAWTGRVVGTYSTTLTPEGYAVESENEPGSVQIYPAAALRQAGEG